MVTENEHVGTEDEEPAEMDHLDEITDGCGCVEIWENLSEYRQHTD